VKKCNFSRKVVPGDALEISVERLPEKQDGLSHFRGAGAVAKKRCFSGNFAGITVPAGDLFEIDDLRSRFSRLTS
jgi:3-hydroxymyristoyl/3-hydroxydecanoyl-(acyl carrier protein) dehydratase